MYDVIPTEYATKINIQQIMKMLPHRYPFLLVDKVFVKEAGKSGCGVKNVSIGEPYFQGHFSTQPILPGVLIIESVAQTIAIVYNSVYLDSAENIDSSENVGYLGAVDFKFIKTVRPGDVMHIYVDLQTKVRNISKFSVNVTVDKFTVAKGSIMVTEKN